MRTTVDIPDEVYRAVKVLAAERGTTVRELVLEGLQMVMRTRKAGHPSRRRHPKSDWRGYRSRDQRRPHGLPLKSEFLKLSTNHFAHPVHLTPGEQYQVKQSESNRRTNPYGQLIVNQSRELRIRLDHSNSSRSRKRRKRQQVHQQEIRKLLANLRSCKGSIPRHERPVLKTKHRVTRKCCGIQEAHRAIPIERKEDYERNKCLQLRN